MASPEIDQLAELHEHVEQLSAQQAAVRQTIAELKARREALVSRLAELNASRPEMPLGADEMLVSALAADPAATPNADAMAEAVARRTASRQAQDAWNTSVSLVEQAISKVDQDVAAQEEAAAQLSLDRGQAWGVFVTLSHEFLVGRFREAFTQLRTDIIEPLVALAQLEDGSGRALVTKGTPTLSSESSLELQSISPDRSGWTMERLFPLTVSLAQRRLDYPKHIARFIASLPPKLQKSK